MEAERRFSVATDKSIQYFLAAVDGMGWDGSIVSNSCRFFLIFHMFMSLSLEGEGSSKVRFVRIE